MSLQRYISIKSQADSRSLSHLRWYLLRQLLVDNGFQLLTILAHYSILEVDKDPQRKSVTELTSLKGFCNENVFEVFFPSKYMTHCSERNQIKPAVT